MIESEFDVQVRSSSKSRDNDGLHKRRGIWHFKLKVAGRWREISTRTSNYQEARRVRQQFIQAQEGGRLPTDMAKWSFEKAADLWLADRTKLVAPQTYRIDKERLVPLKKAFGGRRLCDISGNDIRGYQALRTEQVGPRTINLETKVLRMILRAAKVWARLADDYRSLTENRKGPGRALDPEQEKFLFEIAASKTSWNVAYFAAQLAANTTARSCELKGLRIADIDLIARIMTVRRVTTKTDAGCRVIPLNEIAMRTLARLIQRAQLLGATKPENYLFPAFRFRQTRDGQRTETAGYDPTLPMKSWRTAWRSLTRAIQCPQCGQLQSLGTICNNDACKADIRGIKSPIAGLRFHDLRHHAVTRLAEAGVAEQTLMAIAGHVSREMLEHYSHIRMQAKRDAVAALESPKIPGQEQQESLPVN